MTTQTADPAMAEQRTAGNRIFTDLCRGIESGALRPGDQIPSIRELCIRYDCSTTPVREALAQLKALGLIRGEQGKGTYVTHRPGGTA